MSPFSLFKFLLKIIQHKNYLVKTDILLSCLKTTYNKHMIPKIKIENYNPREDVKLFLRFIDHEYFRQHRSYIFSAFPELREMMKDDSNTRRVIKRFIECQNVTNAKKIKAAIMQERADLSLRQKNMFLALQKSMRYEWKKTIVYRALPTIAPFSPFGRNVFYFSITRAITGGFERNLIRVAAHEISHFIFFDYLKRIEKREKIILSPPAKYFLKEALTAAIFNEKPLKTALGIVKTYSGNYELWDVFLKEKWRKPRQIVDFIREKYRNTKNFEGFLRELILTFNKKERDFEEKQKFWNAHGKAIFSKRNLLKQYSTPIIIEKWGY